MGFSFCFGPFSFFLLIYFHQPPPLTFNPFAGTWCIAHTALLKNLLQSRSKSTHNLFYSTPISFLNVLFRFPMCLVALARCDAHPPATHLTPFLVTILVEEALKTFSKRCSLNQSILRGKHSMPISAKKSCCAVCHVCLSHAVI